MFKGIVFGLLLTTGSAFAAEKSISKSESFEKAIVNVGQAYATGQDSDLWGQSSVSLKFEPALQLDGHNLSSLGAGIEGESHSDANFLNSYFDQDSRELEFKIHKESLLKWTTTKRECSLDSIVRVVVINNPVFRLEGFGGTEFDAYNNIQRSSEKISWERCLELMR